MASKKVVVAPPLVYVDACIFLNVIKHETDAWVDALKLLTAAERGDVRLAASTLLVVEVGRHRGDTPRADVDAVVGKYLDALDVVWVEIDRLVADKARDLSHDHGLFSADAVHLASAVRARADHFVSRDRKYPYGRKIDGVAVQQPPCTFWQPHMDDHDIDQQFAAEELARLERAN